MHCVARIVSYSYYRNAACSMLLLLLLPERESIFSIAASRARVLFIGQR